MGDGPGLCDFAAGDAGDCRVVMPGARQIWNWKVLDNKTLIVEDDTHQKFKMSLMGYCPDLEFKERIGFKSFGGSELSCLGSGDDVLARDIAIPDRCPITNVVPYTPAMEAADKAARPRRRSRIQSERCADEDQDFGARAARLPRPRAGDGRSDMPGDPADLQLKRRRSADLDRREHRPRQIQGDVERAVPAYRIQYGRHVQVVLEFRSGVSAARRPDRPQRRRHGKRLPDQIHRTLYAGDATSRPGRSRCKSE